MKQRCVETRMILEGCEDTPRKKIDPVRVDAKTGAVLENSVEGKNFD
jgi:hypothetical protein